MKKNSVANYNYSLGLIVIGFGIIGSIICGAVFEEYSYNWAFAVFGSIGSLLVGSLFIALSEIIELLHGIYPTKGLTDETNKTMSDFEDKPSSEPRPKKIKEASPHFPYYESDPS